MQFDGSSKRTSADSQDVPLSAGPRPPFNDDRATEFEKSLPRVH